MKLKIVMLLIVVMILIIQLPVLANDEIPEPPGPYTPEWQYWVMFTYGSQIRCVYSLEPIKARTDGKLYIFSYREYILTEDGWEYNRWGAGELETWFGTIYSANHDIYYKDGSGIFFLVPKKPSQIYQTMATMDFGKVLRNFSTGLIPIIGFMILLVTFRKALDFLQSQLRS